MQGHDATEAGPSRAAAPTFFVNTAASTPPNASGTVNNALDTPGNTTQHPYYHSSPQPWAQHVQWHAYNPQPGVHHQQGLTPYHPPVSFPAQGGSTAFQQQVAERPVPRSPSPPPPPPYQRHWDAVIKRFLDAAGLTQASRGFQSDMLVMSSEWEEKTVPAALATLREDLVRLDILGEDSPLPEVKGEPLDERKLQHAHFAKGVEPRMPSTVTKSISQFLAQNRARNDASNRREFLLSLAEKRQRLSEEGDSQDPTPSCARTDAKTQNRDIQMKYDIAKNEDGPLRKTLKRDQATSASDDKADAPLNDTSDTTASRCPGLDERLRNVETHIAVRYVPSPPRSLLDRLKFLEDHLIRLEKDYPPWAALHFNQPHRGWPPPPRPTPIIVPSHLTVVTEHIAPQHTSQDQHVPPGVNEPSKAKSKSASRSTVSSLQRAVMERLEVQKAMNDLGAVKSEPK